MGKIVITSGQPFTDIDALACAIAYTELLNLEGKDAEAVLPGRFNKSITKKIIDWGLNYRIKPSTEKAKYVIVDVSEPKFFAKFVKEKDLIELFDHRYGFEKLWENRLDNSSHIELVGSCATLIFEEFIKRARPLQISVTSSNLLLAAIVSNTLNFKSSVTTKRDLNSFEILKKYSNLKNDWIQKYFEDQEAESMKDPETAIKNDTKGTGEAGKEYVIGQLEFWDSRKFLKVNLKVIQKTLESYGRKYWFLTSPSISEGINYIYTKNYDVKKLLGNIIGAKFDGDIGTTEKLWLRKEILNLIK